MINSFMLHIKDILKKNIRKNALEPQVQTSLIIVEFDNLIKSLWGLNYQKKIKPLYVKNKILTVACLNSVIIQVITLRKPELIDKINQKFSLELIKDIKFII